MANATPVHKTETPKRKPLSKDAAKIKAELAESESKATEEVAPEGVELADGTIRKDF